MRPSVEKKRLIFSRFSLCANHKYFLESDGVEQVQILVNQRRVCIPSSVHRANSTVHSTHNPVHSAHNHEHSAHNSVQSTHIPVHKLYSTGTVTLRISDNRPPSVKLNRRNEKIRKRSATEKNRKRSGVEKPRKRSGVYSSYVQSEKSVIKPVILIKSKVSVNQKRTRRIYRYFVC